MSQIQGSGGIHSQFEPLNVQQDRQQGNVPEGLQNAHSGQGVCHIIGRVVGGVLTLGISECIRAIVNCVRSASPEETPQARLNDHAQASRSESSLGPLSSDDAARVRAALAPEKDIDGITDGSLAGVFTNTDLGYAPCTAQACMEILKYYNVPLSGKRAVVVGRSLVVGKPAAMMLDRENATVTLCNSRTRNLPEVCRQADIVVVAMGKMGAVGADCLREGQTVVDVGIHVNEEGKLCGDVQFSAAEPVVDAITPVPGGVGTVTTSVLVGHVVQAACKKAGVEC